MSSARALGENGGSPIRRQNSIEFKDSELVRKFALESLSNNSKEHHSHLFSSINAARSPGSRGGRAIGAQPGTGLGGSLKNVISRADVAPLRMEDGTHSPHGTAKPKRAGGGSQRVARSNSRRKGVGDLSATGSNKWFEERKTESSGVTDAEAEILKVC
jgi:hypothetical protein